MEVIDKELEQAAKYRRLRILYNRLALFGTPVFYTYWRESIFPTALGLRRVLATSYTAEGSDMEINELIYENPEVGVALFNIIWNRNVCRVTNTNLTDEQVWLAIYEIEQMAAEACRHLVQEVD